jgi:hypothetical protein
VPSVTPSYQSREVCHAWSVRSRSVAGIVTNVAVVSAAWSCDQMGTRVTSSIPSGFSDGARMFVFYYVDTYVVDHGRAVLGVSDDGGPSFRSLLDVPYPMAFVAPRVVPTRDVPSLASEWSDPDTVVMWGRWRVHPPILAAAPLHRVDDLGSWRFYTPSSADGTSPWSATIGDAPQVYTPDDGYNCRGPFTVMPAPQIDRWLMIEQCIPSQIQARVATNALGPWSPPVVLFDMIRDGGRCHYFHKKCDPAVIDSNDPMWCCDTNFTPASDGFGPGGATPFPYGAFPIEPLTRWDPASSTLTLISLLSTFNPYTAVVTKTQLALAR